jgi:hypothetical protein
MLRLSHKYNEILDLIQNWCSTMQGMRKFPPDVQKQLLKVGR